MPASLQWIRVLLVALATAGLAAQKTPEEALRALTEGNHRFAADRSVPQPIGEGVRRTLARGQSPFAVVVCCSDSRVPPEHVFNCGLGELFVIRIAGNTCDPETLASIEYAVEHLNTPLVVVMGHENCGAVAAAANQVLALEQEQTHASPSRAIQGLIEQIEPAVRKARARDFDGKELHDACEEENVHRAMHNFLRRSQLLRRYVEVGRLEVVPARYHLDSGEVEWLPVRPLPVEPKHDVDHALHTAPPAAPPHVALRMLQAGHRRFLGDSVSGADLTATRRETLTHGQQPLAIVLTCADSRVAPEHVFDSGLGELFVIRVAGNIVNDDVLASIEYAAAHTGSSLLVVMGHTGCGAITAASSHPEGQQLSPNMRALLARLEPSVEKVRGRTSNQAELVELAVRANVLRAATEVHARSKLLRDLELRGRFAILPVIYDTASGDLTWIKNAPGQAGAAAPMASPLGETVDDNHGSADDTDHSSQGTHDKDSAHSSAPNDPGVPDQELSWADPVAHGSGGQDHGEPAHTAPDHGPSDDGEASHDAHADPAPDDHGDASHDAHGASTAAPPGAHGASYTKNKWLDPIPLVGMAGIVSLLLAGCIALIKR